MSVFQRQFFNIDGGAGICNEETLRELAVVFWTICQTSPEWFLARSFSFTSSIVANVLLQPWAEQLSRENVIWSSIEVVKKHVRVGNLFPDRASLTYFRDTNSDDDDEFDPPDDTAFELESLEELVDQWYFGLQCKSYNDSTCKLFLPKICNYC